MHVRLQKVVASKLSLDWSPEQISGWPKMQSNHCPNVLAISDDSRLLNVGIDGAVQRFLLPGLVSDINFSLPVDSFGGGPFFALDLQVAPGVPELLIRRYNARSDQLNAGCAGRDNNI
jgi:hypothetical protein